MSFSDTFYNLRSANSTMVQVADAIDGLARGETSNSTVTATGSETASSDGIIFVNNSSNITRTLPAPSAAQGKRFIYVKISDNANTCTIATPSGSIFNKGDNVLRQRNDIRIYVSNGSNYFSLDGEDFPSSGTSWTPVYGGNNLMTWTGVTTVIAAYWPLGSNLRFVTLEASGTIGGTPDNTLTIGMPFVLAGSYQNIPCALTQSTFPSIASAWAFSSTVQIQKPDASNFSAGSIIFGMQGIVRI